MTELKTSCKGMETKLAGLLLEPESAPAAVREHVAGCEGCRGEIDEMKTVMGLMDAWKAPEPSPYFFTRLNAKMREERGARPAGWLERLRARLAYGPRMRTQPVAAMALTVMLLVGGGTYLSLYDLTQPKQTSDATVINDLQTLDNNAQVLDTLENLSSQNGDGN